MGKKLRTKSSKQTQPRRSSADAYNIVDVRLGRLAGVQPLREGQPKTPAAALAYEARAGPGKHHGAIARRG